MTRKKKAGNSKQKMYARRFSGGQETPRQFKNTAQVHFEEGKKLRSKGYFEAAKRHFSAGDAYTAAAVKLYSDGEMDPGFVEEAYRLGKIAATTPRRKKKS